MMNTEQVLRLIQSIPSKKAEPFKLWLAKVGKERIDEAYDPEIAIHPLVCLVKTENGQRHWRFAPRPTCAGNCIKAAIR